jgi:hypothetical protein
MTSTQQHIHSLSTVAEPTVDPMIDDARDPHSVRASGDRRRGIGEKR